VASLTEVSYDAIGRNINKNDAAPLIVRVEDLRRRGADSNVGV
jgi:hypothetical protein